MRFLSACELGFGFGFGFGLPSLLKLGRGGWQDTCRIRGVLLMGRWMGRDTRSEERGIRILIFMRCDGMDGMGWDGMWWDVGYDMMREY